MAEAIASYSYRWPKPPRWRWLCELYPDRITVTGGAEQDTQNHVHRFKDYEHEPSATLTNRYDVAANDLAFFYSAVVMSFVGIASREIPAFVELPLKLQLIAYFIVFISLFAVLGIQLGKRYTSTEVRFSRRDGTGYFSLHSPHEDHDEEFAEFLKLVQRTMKLATPAGRTVEHQRV